MLIILILFIPFLYYCGLPVISFYPVDRVIRPLNNWGLVVNSEITLTPAELKNAAQDRAT